MRADASSELIDFIEICLHALNPVLEQIRPSLPHKFSSAAELLKADVIFHAIVVSNVDNRIAREELDIVMDLYCWAENTDSISTEAFRAISQDVSHNYGGTFGESPLFIPPFLAEIDDYDRVHQSQLGELYRRMYMNLAEIILSADRNIASEEKDWFESLRDALRVEQQDKRPEYSP